MMGEGGRGEGDDGERGEEMMGEGEGMMEGGGGDNGKGGEDNSFFSLPLHHLFLLSLPLPSPSSPLFPPFPPPTSLPPAPPPPIILHYTI